MVIAMLEVETDFNENLSYRDVILTTLIFPSILFPYWILREMFKYYPPKLDLSDRRIDENLVDKKLSSLQMEIGRIEKSLNNVDNLTISQIQYELKLTLAFVQKLKLEAIN